MNNKSHSCPHCSCVYAYPDGQQWICPECFYEWSRSDLP